MNWVDPNWEDKLKAIKIYKQFRKNLSLHDSFSKRYLLKFETSRQTPEKRQIKGCD